MEENNVVVANAVVEESTKDVAVAENVLVIDSEKPKVKKVCTTCKVEKDISEFYKAPSNKKDGHFSYCKSCCKEYRIEYDKKLKQDHSKKVVCTKCKVEKNVSEFYKDASTKSGYAYYCKACRRKYNQAQRKAWKKDKLETKICCTCKANKKISEFYKNASTKSGYATLCKTCQKKYTRDWEKAHKEKRIEYSNKSKKKNKVKVMENKVMAFFKKMLSFAGIVIK